MTFRTFFSRHMQVASVAFLGLTITSCVTCTYSLEHAAYHHTTQCVRNTVCTLGLGLKCTSTLTGAGTVVSKNLGGILYLARKINKFVAFLLIVYGALIAWVGFGLIPDEEEFTGAWICKSGNDSHHLFIAGVSR